MKQTADSVVKEFIVPIPGLFATESYNTVSINTVDTMYDMIGLDYLSMKFTIKVKPKVNKNDYEKNIFIVPGSTNNNALKT